MAMDGMAENCSCVFCTSAIRGGRMPRAQDAQERLFQVKKIPIRATGKFYYDIIGIADGKSRCAY
jgi:hypothetical protein